MKVILIVLAAAGIMVLGLELVLRLVFGFGTPLLYRADPQIGYLLAPNQRIRRLGNRIEVNQFSMRSAPIDPTCPAQTKRILLLGDSIVNGGWWTDQPEILSELLAATLSAHFSSQDQPASALPPLEVLNASANSWGPRNQLAYLQRFGSFQAQTIVLILNTDDLFSLAPDPTVVGRDRNYPDRTPATAISELLQRYLSPRLPQWVPQYFKKSAPKSVQTAPVVPVVPETGDEVAQNLAAIAAIVAMAQAQDRSFLLAMTPLRRELAQEGGPRNYEQKARQRLHDWTIAAGIPYLDFLPVFDAQAQPLDLYRDHIHLSPAGNELVSETLGRAIVPYLS